MNNEIYRRVKEFKRKYPMTIAFRLRAHAKIVSKFIGSDEEIRYVFVAQKNYQSYEIINTNIIVLTDKRLVVATKRLVFGYFLKVITPDMFNDLTIKQGPIWGKVIIDTIKEEVIHEIKKDAKDYLETLLAETSFERWEQKWHMNTKNRKKTIPKYLKSIYCNKNDNLSEQMKKTIHELVEISNISTNSNTELLAELYTDLKNRTRQENKRRKQGEIRLMDDKYLSDLLNVSLQKEKLMHLIVTPNLDNRDELIKQQKRRCLLITRQDLLPLILCLSQKRYVRRMESENYDAVKAKAEFIDFANHILNACQMAPIDENKYELDGILCGCFQKDEMYSLADTLERYFDMEKKNNA